jgi:chromosome segregation ATPase
MDKKELKTQVQEIVDELFSAKEEADIRKNTEKELEKSATMISDLTKSLEDKNSEVSELEEKISESDSRIAELESELEAAKNQVSEKEEELSKRDKSLTKKDEEIAAVNHKLEEINKDKVAEKRMTDLEEAGVANSDQEFQVAKVREMTDEEFASYKEELTAIRQAIVDELKKAGKSEEDNEEKKRKVEAEKNKSQASLNMEYEFEEEAAKKWNELGAAMAERWFGERQ